MFDWILKLLFRPKTEIKPFIEETTKNFKDFKRFQSIKHPHLAETEKNMLCRYVCQTKRSPYVGDQDLEQARDLLIKNGIDPDKVL